MPTARERMLQLSPLASGAKAREHFLAIEQGAGTIYGEVVVELMGDLDVELEGDLDVSVEGDLDIELEGDLQVEVCS